MALVVNTNVSSLNTQNALSKNTKSYDTALQRLSSGLRINSAADDAAGLAISNGLEAQYNGLNQATSNANDGLSLLGTAESAMNTQVDLLQRMRELSVESASDTESGTDRAAINKEVSQLKEEFDRVSTTTTFNGQSLLDGSFSDKQIQVGAYSGSTQAISVDLDSTRSASMGKIYSAASTATSTTTTTTTTDVAAVVPAGIISNLPGETGYEGKLEAGQMTINGVAVPASTITGGSYLNYYNNVQSIAAAAGITVAFSGPSFTMTSINPSNDIVIAFAAGAHNTAAEAAAMTGLTAGTYAHTTSTGTTSTTSVTQVGSAGITSVTPSATGAVSITANGKTTQIGKTSDDGVSYAGGTGSALAYATAINASSGDTGVTATAEATSATAKSAQSAGSIADGDLTINGVSVGAITVASATDTSVVDAINNITSSTGVTATLDSNNKLVLTAADGRNVTVTTKNSAATYTGLGSGGAGTTAGAVTTTGQVKLSSNSGVFTVTDTSDLLGMGGGTGGTFTAVKGAESISSVDVTTKDGANTAINAIDSALEQLNSSLANIGAQTNRLSSVVDNLSSAAANVASSKSTIMDADFAKETSNMTKDSILQQAAVSVLSQANSSPQLALSLLK